MEFGSKRKHYVVRDCSQPGNLSSFAEDAILRQLVLHSLITFLLVAAAVAMSW